MGGVQLPEAPEFVINVRRGQEERKSGGASGQPQRGRLHMRVHRPGDGANLPGGDEPNADDQRLIDAQVERLTGDINRMLQNFQALFTGHQFLRMQQAMNGVAPGEFMGNFNSSFAPGDDVFEMVRRMSEQEAERNRRKNKAKPEVVEKLPIIKIEEKHCKANKMAPGKLRATASKQTLEPPTCTVCCEHIQLGSKGMFMPCGHIYHPDCLKPWLENNHTCPVCRFELPKQDG